MRRALLLVLLAACTKTSEKYCMMHGADDPAHCAAPDAATGSHCDTSGDCMAPLPACALDTHVCVPCIDDSACANRTPVCTAQHACTACTKHSDCMSDACLPDGSCAAQGDVAYVDGDHGTPTNTACTKQMQCDTLTRALATPKHIIRITGVIDDSVMIDDRADPILVLGDATAVLAHNSGTLLAISGTSTVTVHDLTIGGANPTNSVGVQLASGASGTTDLEHCTVKNQNQGGIKADNGKLVVNRSMIANNAQGGIIIHSGVSSFTIRNSFIVGNGKIGAGPSSQGGVLVEADVGGHIEFNTVVANLDSSGSNKPGISCLGNSNFAGGNIVAQNTEMTTGTNDTNQAGGTCQYGSSLMLASATGLAFKALAADPPDLHLTTASPATVHDAGGTCGAAIGPDYDGDERPQGVACDLGADELK